MKNFLLLFILLLSVGIGTGFSQGVIAVPEDDNGYSSSAFAFNEGYHTIDRLTSPQEANTNAVHQYQTVELIGNDFNYTPTRVIRCVRPIGAPAVIQLHNYYEDTYGNVKVIRGTTTTY